ncbi:hypothetical protein D0Z00_000658 [Geotrichum galactomycetum]|uniref:Uncharacterized protein n=1 Tax=Geotrichum galactomycetum TaxID=27317 RepID=A0ACB6V931_9ASCO|nr:hypothetical protein D0Z00_000658 [Geotrichum candidum]
MASLQPSSSCSSKTSGSHEKQPPLSANNGIDEGKPSIVSAIILSLMAAFGGFIYGYDTGSISGILNLPPFLRNFGRMHEDGSYYFPVYRSGLIVGIVSIGGLFGGLISSRLTDTHGRIKTIFGFNILYAVSLIIQITATKSWVQIMMGRLFTGMAIGAFTVAVPMLISECVPSNLRDACVSCFQFMVTLSILIGNAVCYGVRHTEGNGGYQVPIGLGFIFSTILFLAILILPESPRYLASVGKVEEAQKALARTVRMDPNSNYIVNEMREILNSVENDKAQGDASWSEIFTGKPKMFYRIMVGIFTLSLQQLCGANYFFYYGTSLFTSLGSNDSFATAMILSGVNCGCTLIGMFLVNRIGRRKLLMFGSVVMLVSFLIFASLGSFALYTDNNDPNGPVNASIGRAMIFFACLFIFGFATTWAPLAFVVVAEIFPQRIRSKGMALGTGSLWIWNFLISFFTPMITNNIGYKYGYVFSGCVLFSIFFVYFAIHETQGVTLEEINEMYGSGVKPWNSSKHIKEIRAMRNQEFQDTTSSEA